MSNVQQQQQRPPRDPEADKRKIFCKGLPWESREDDIRTLDVFKDAVSIDIAYERSPDGETKKSRGFCYILFETEEEAKNAYDNRFKCELGGRKLFLDLVGNSRNQGRAQGDNKKLFVKGLPWTATEDEVCDLFQNALKVEIKRDDENKSRGFGYIEFESPQDANDAFENRFSAEMGGRKLFLDFTGKNSRFNNRGRGRGGGQYRNNGQRDGGYRGQAPGGY